MRAIYEPNGKAREYCERAVNLFLGCDHGPCAYCFAPAVLHMGREDFAKVRPRPGIIEAIKREAPRHAGCEVLLCFTTDAFCPGADVVVTLEAIRILQTACRVNVLTKGGERSRLALSVLRPGVDRYGVTLTFTSAVYSVKWEPRAAWPDERIAVLAAARRAGLSTWASLEPVIDPEQSLELIKRVAHAADVVNVGKWNYDKRAAAIDWPDFAQRALDAGKRWGVRVVLKMDLAACLGGGARPLT